MNRHEVFPSNLLNKLRLAEPLRVRADLMLGHGGERIHFVRKLADDRNFGDQVDERQKRRSPGFHEHYAAVFSQDALHFRKCLVQVPRQIR